MRRFLIFALVVAAVVLGLRAWREWVLVRQSERAFARAGELVASGRPADALALASVHRPRAKELDWNALEVSAQAAQRNLPALLRTFDQQPARVLADESACLAVGHALMQGRRSESWETVRAAWRGRETRPASWRLLEADHLVRTGDVAGATQLLEIPGGSNAEEAMRLVRRALLEAPRDLTKSWRLLEQAQLADPRNPEVRSFRGQLLESTGRFAAARVEYVAAVVAAPGNPLLRDQLAEFYRRQGSLELALATWKEATQIGTLDFVWLKAAVWSRLVDPSLAPSTPPAGLAGRLAPFVHWLSALPPGRFWDESAQQRDGNVALAARGRDDVELLRTVDALLRGDEAAVREALPSRLQRGRAAAPRFERALARLLNYRAHGSLNPPGLPVAAPSASDATAHAFFGELEELARQEKTGVSPSAEAHTFLTGPSVLGGALLAAGFRAAALQALPEGTWADEASTPEWLIYGYAQCLRYRGPSGPAQALAFLEGRKQTPTLQVLAAELLLADRQSEAGLARLVPLSAQPGPAGARAAWLLAEAAFERGDLVAARRYVQAQPALVASEAGREQLARLDLAEQRPAAPESLAARVEQARRAFAERNWAEARRLTLELLRELPDALELRANLVRIDAAEAGK
ncbi:MAG: hypothetical protein JSR82_01700 [Verrucomicrobia bacterium]|nr:hypothetical protein [Verrucomicrobiota bacterium]